MSLGFVGGRRRCLVDDVNMWQEAIRGRARGRGSDEGGGGSVVHHPSLRTSDALGQDCDENE
eukprot:767004-Hanusia_phi.AAC.3